MDEIAILYQKCNEALSPSGVALKISLSDIKHELDSHTIWKNRCIECYVNLGECNPRQLCGKSRCYSGKFDISDNHYEYASSIDDILDTFIRLIKLCYECDIDDIEFPSFRELIKIQ